MDFQSLTRRELQFLCKKNRIPANMTNVAMADALQALPSVDGIGEIQDSSDFLSPKKAELSSSIAPRTTRRTSVRKKIEPVEDCNDQAGSPLPRARRVTAKTPEIMRIIYQEEEKDVEEEKQRKEEIVPDPKPQATVTRSTRRRATKKEEAVGENANAVEVTINTPATRNGRKMTSRRGGATPVPVEEVQEGREDASRTTRRTRQSTKSIATAATTTVGTRSSRRGKAAALVSKMEPFDPQEQPQQEQMQQEKDERYEDIQDTVDGSVEKSPDLGEAVCSLNPQDKVVEEQVNEEQLSVEKVSQSLSPHKQIDCGLSGRNELPESEVAEVVKEEEYQELVEQKQEGDALLHDQEDGGLSGQEELPEFHVAEDVKEDEIEIQVKCLEDKVSDAEEECHELVEQEQDGDVLHDQEDGGLSGREELAESQVAEDVKENDEIRIQVKCQEEQVSEAEDECLELVEQEQVSEVEVCQELVDQEESPIKGLITEDQQKKLNASERLDLISSDNILEESKECIIHLPGYQPIEADSISIGQYSENSSLALDNDGSKIEEVPVNDEEDCAYSAVDKIFISAGNSMNESAEMSAEFSDKLRNVIGDFENIKISEVNSSPEVENLTNTSSEAELKDDVVVSSEILEETLGSISSDAELKDDVVVSSEILEETLGSISSDAELKDDVVVSSEILEETLGSISPAESAKEVRTSIVENDSLTVVEENINEQSSDFGFVTGDQASGTCQLKIWGVPEEVSLDVEVVTGDQTAAGVNKPGELVETATDACKEVSLDVEVVTGDQTAADVNKPGELVETATDACKEPFGYVLNQESKTFAGMDASAGVKAVDTEKTEGGVKKQGIPQLSLRKLKKIYKEKITSEVNKVEGKKRLPLSKLNENLP